MKLEQRQALHSVKLKALVAEHWPDARATPVAFPAGAALIDEATSTGWCLVAAQQRDRDPLDVSDDGVDAVNPRGWLGGAVVWARRRGLERLHLLLDHVTGDDARRAALLPVAPTLWSIDGRKVHEVVPTPFAPVPAPDAVSELFREVIVDGGAVPVVDHGILRAEVLGLEVGRVVHGEDGVPRLDVGVGRHDRLANAMLGHDRDILASLRNAVAAVAGHRRRGAAGHPANQLARERWLRAEVMLDPVSIGLDREAVLDAVEGTEPAALKRHTPAIALGTAVVVACCSPSDLDAIAFALDARAAYAPSAELVLVFDADPPPSLRGLAGLVDDCRVVVLAPA